MPDRFFLDTAYVQAILNVRDHAHAAAQAMLPRVRSAQEVCTTEAILVEVGNALSRTQREAAVAFIDACYVTPNIQVVNVDTALLRRALDLYGGRRDKTWGLTDCISFVVMQDRDLMDALTTDEHFRQAGFRPVLLDGV